MHGTSNMSAGRFIFNRMPAEEFIRKLDKAKMSVNDFMFITGRHSHGVSIYLDPKGDKSPTLAEIVLLELAGESEEFRRRIFEIADARMVDIGQRKDRSRPKEPEVQVIRTRKRYD